MCDSYLDGDLSAKYDVKWRITAAAAAAAASGVVVQS